MTAPEKKSPTYSPQKFASEQFGWCSSTAATTPRNERRSNRSPARSAVRARPCATACGRPSVTAGCGPAPPARSRHGSRRWSARTASCARPSRSCARPVRILPRRGLATGSSHDGVHRSPPRRDWVQWFNHQRLLGLIGNIQPAAAEAA